MTEERERLKEIVDNLMGGIKREQKIKEQERKISRLEKEVNYHKKGIVFKLKRGFLTVAVLAGLGFGGYKGYEYIKERNQIKQQMRLKREKELEQMRMKTQQKDEQKIKRTFDYLLSAINYKDKKLLRKYVICDESNRGHGFIEMMLDRTLQKNYKLRRLKILKKPELQYSSNPYWQYHVNVEADFISAKRIEKLKGLVEVQCEKYKCRIWLYKRPCPDYLQKYKEGMKYFYSSRKATDLFNEVIHIYTNLRGKFLDSNGKFRIFLIMDKNNDGVLTEEEIKPYLQDQKKLLKEGK